MGYSVKWVVENLGITRDMLRYYEKEKLIPVTETRNPSNKYRDYNEGDIERIWAIKLLIGIGNPFFWQRTEFQLLRSYVRKGEAT